MKVVQFVDEGLGNAAHLLVSEGAGAAALIDPLRDVDVYLAEAARLGVAITAVLETHLHNDFVSGGRELARQTGASLYASAAAGLQFDHVPLHDGEVLVIGTIKLTALATPGHTPEHLAYLAEDQTDASAPSALFSGGCLLVGSVARTDLLGHEHAAGLARDLYWSLEEKILPLDDRVLVYPTHGAGSFCTAAPGSARSTLLGAERRSNPFLQLHDPEAFTRTVLDGLSTYPTYFTHMRGINQQGPRVLGGVPALSPLSPGEVHRLAGGAHGILDIRPVSSYAQGHIPASYHSEHRAGFASWVGWVVPFGTPLVLVVDSTDVIDDAVRQLIRIGYEDLTGYLDGGIATWEQTGLPVARFPVLTVAELRDLLGSGSPALVLDVRQAAEWDAGHIPGAFHVEAGSLGPDARIPRDRPIAVHCGHAPRAATALSVLERMGYRDLNLVDGGFGAWERAKFPIQSVASPGR